MVAESKFDRNCFMNVIRAHAANDTNTDSMTAGTYCKILTIDPGSYSYFRTKGFLVTLYYGEGGPHIWEGSFSQEILHP